MESVRFEFTKKIDSIPKADKYDSAIDAVRAKKQEQQNEEIRFNFTKKIDTVPNNISPFDRITQMGKDYFKNQQKTEDLLTRIPSVNYNEDYAKVKNISDSDIVDYFLETQYQSEKKRLEDEKAAIESGLRQFASEGVTQIAENAGIPGARFESDRINRNNAETMREVNRINGELEALVDELAADPHVRSQFGQGIGIEGQVSGLLRVETPVGQQFAVRDAQVKQAQRGQ